MHEVTPLTAQADRRGTQGAAEVCAVERGKITRRPQFIFRDPTGFLITEQSDREDMEWVATVTVEHHGGPGVDALEIDQRLVDTARKDHLTHFTLKSIDHGMSEREALIRLAIMHAAVIAAHEERLARCVEFCTNPGFIFPTHPEGDS